MKKVRAIWAESRNKVIGMGLNIPWQIPEDFKHFQETTMNGSIIMGRNTFHSLPKILKDREHIVLARNKELLLSDPKMNETVIIVDSIEEAVDTAKNEAWVIGGGQIYQAFLPLLSELVISEVDMLINGDGLVYAPDVSEFKLERVTPWMKSINEKNWRIKYLTR